jgi:hypothetical protein
VAAPHPSRLLRCESPDAPGTPTAKRTAQSFPTVSRAPPSRPNFLLHSIGVVFHCNCFTCPIASLTHSAARSSGCVHLSTLLQPAAAGGVRHPPLHPLETLFHSSGRAGRSVSDAGPAGGGAAARMYSSEPNEPPSAGGAGNASSASTTFVLGVAIRGGAACVPRPPVGSELG